MLELDNGVWIGGLDWIAFIVRHIERSVIVILICTFGCLIRKLDKTLVLCGLP